MSAPSRKPPSPSAVRRRYEVGYDQTKRLYVVEVVDQTGERRQVEAYADWLTADRMRSACNARLQETGAYLPDRR